MSATPRPWTIEQSDTLGICITPENPRSQIVSTGVRRDNANLIVRAVNAFDALLAVAKAAEWPRTRESEEFCAVCRTMAEPHEPECPYAKLDSSCPGWREWTA